MRFALEFPASHRLRLLPLLALLALAARSGRADLYVSHQSSPPAIVVYADDATAEATPLREITGPSTQLSLPGGLALDLEHRELFVADQGGRVLVFALEADGDAVPARVIEGASTGFTNPTGIAVDLVHDEIVVVDVFAKSVSTFARDADGNVEPLRMISGDATDLTFPGPVVVDLEADEIYVSDPYAMAVLVFDRAADGDVAPLRSYGESFPGGIFVDKGADELIVTLPLGNAVRAEPLVSGSTRTLSGASTGLSQPLGVLLTTTGKLWTANFESSGLVLAFSGLADGEHAPLQSIERPSGEPATLASDRALGCAEGFAVGDCLFRGNFESGHSCRWSATEPAVDC